MSDSKHADSRDKALDLALASLPQEADLSPSAREALMNRLDVTAQAAQQAVFSWQRTASRAIAAVMIFAFGAVVGRGSAHARAEPTLSPAANVERAGTQYVASITRWESAGDDSSGGHSDVPEVAVAAIAAAAVEVASATPNDTLLARLAALATGARDHLGVVNGR